MSLVWQIPDENEITVGEAFTGKLKLENPLPVQLTYCKFYLESPGLGEPLKLKVKEYVSPSLKRV